MPSRFDKFAHDENLKNFTRLLATETDPARLAQIRLVLKEERARGAAVPPPRVK